jgi:hypothetical protein
LKFKKFSIVHYSSVLVFRSWISFTLSALSLVSHSWILVWFLIWFSLVSHTYAAPLKAFPNISFDTFSSAITSSFGSNISLATVLAILFTLTENPDLLNLHFRQQNPEFSGENRVHVSGWIIALVNALMAKLGTKRTETLFSPKENLQDLDEKGKIYSLAGKLDKLANALALSPYDSEGNYKGKLLPASGAKIEPTYTICPTSFICGTQDCQGQSLVQSSRDRDIPIVTLTKGHTIYKKVPVLTGRCPRCKTLYSADHERFKDTSTAQTKLKRVYLNSAKYMKVGKRLWVDRLFSTSTINAMYNFHASAYAYAEYWNNTFGTESTSVTRAQIWQAFVQQSVRTIAEESKIDVEFDDALNIKEVTTAAFSLLGENGIICAADKHACDECTQKHRKTSDVVDVVFDDPAAVVGVDATDDDIPALVTDHEDPEVDLHEGDEMDVDNIRDTTLVTLDGVVMGPQVNELIIF